MNEGCINEQKARSCRSLEERRNKDEKKRKLNQFFIERTQKQKKKDMFLSQRRWKKVRGTKTERTKDGKQELGGMEWFHKKIRYGRRDSQEPQFHSGVSAAGFVLFRHYKERFTWLRISPIVVGARHMFYLAGSLGLGWSGMDVCLLCSPLCARGRRCRATSPYC